MTAKIKPLGARTETAYVRHYLESLTASKPAGKRTPERLQSLVDTLPALIEQETDVVRRVELTQRLLDAERDLESVKRSLDHSEVERLFIQAAPGFSARKGVTYAAWRRNGVPARVLQAAGIR